MARIRSMKTKRIIDVVMEEPIRLIGCPQIIVTRAWAYDWFVKIGHPKTGGFNSADYMAFAGKVADEELTDLTDPNVQRFLSAVEKELGR